MTRSQVLGLAFATAAAGLFATTGIAPAVADDAAAMKCDASSSCKGHGSCKSASNSCKGQNGCKGQGFTMQKSADECMTAQKAAKPS